MSDDYFTANETTAVEAIKKLDPKVRDSALQRIVGFKELPASKRLALANAVAENHRPETVPERQPATPMVRRLARMTPEEFAEVGISTRLMYADAVQAERERIAGQSTAATFDHVGEIAELTRRLADADAKADAAPIGTAERSALMQEAFNLSVRRHAAIREAGL